MIYILIILVVIMLFNNMKRAKTVRRDQEYVNIYSKLLRNEEGAAEELDKYIENETDNQIKNKALIVKIYQDLTDGIGVDETLKSLDIRTVYGVNGKITKESVLANSESFIWALMVIAKTKNLENMEVLKTFYGKYKELEEELKSFVEYQVIKSAYECITGDDTGKEFLTKLLNAEYAEYFYDKNLVGMYKDIAASILVMTGEEMDEFGNENLKVFATKQVGSRIMTNLGVIDKFLTVEEETVEEEEKEEE
ncbi:MAG: hypothetical protein Q4B60_00865 [Erysipelotrichaceae bacterium]|nr:hypothetical protein [Erysipelotrichaceae bacterium]